MLREAAKTLQRLGTHADLYLMHSPHLPEVGPIVVKATPRVQVKASARVQVKASARLEVKASARVKVKASDRVQVKARVQGSG